MATMCQGQCSGLGPSLSHLSSCLCQPTESFGGGTDGLAELGQFAVLGVLGDASHGLAQHLQEHIDVDTTSCSRSAPRLRAHCGSSAGLEPPFPLPSTSYPNPPHPSPDLLRAHLGVLHDTVEAVEVGHVIDCLGGVLQQLLHRLQGHRHHIQGKGPCPLPASPSCPSQ